MRDSVLLQRSIVLAGFVLLACSNSDDDERAASDDTSAASGESMTSANTTGASRTGGTSTDSTGDTADTIADSTRGTTQGTDDTDDTDGSDDTTGVEVCTIELPPPAGSCEGNIIDPWKPSLVVAGPSTLRAADELTAPVELEADTHDTDGDDDGGGGFIDPPDDPPSNIECDIWEQDCPAGEKCMPWDNSGSGSWNATKCTPLDPNAVPIGEACTVQGSGVSGIDDCELGAMCWKVDPETNMGTCIELCSCSPENPICETTNTFCSITNQGVLPLCLGVCNPLDPDACDSGEGCYPVGQYFGCAPNASSPNQGDAGDPCQFLNVCNHGLMCLGVAFVPGCAGASGCCSSFCTIGDDSPCLPSQSCVPFYEQGQAPDACLGEVGVCMIPS